MFGTVSRNILRSRTPLTLFSRRHFSAKAIYSSFPATLLYYSPRQQSSLYDIKESDGRPDDLYDEGIAVEKNGLVYPAVNKKTVSNGAVMFPNTFMMQELIRRYFDEALDREDEGKEVETSYVYTIPKGTPIPSHLILINEFISRFSLQPSYGMPLEDLNRSLDEFYRNHPSKNNAEDWLDKHPFQGAVADDADPIWMAK